VTGIDIDTAMTTAGLTFGNPPLPPGYRQMAIPSLSPNMTVLGEADCVCVVSYSPAAAELAVECQSICQRVSNPEIVDVVVLLRGNGLYDWDDTNSGFSLDEGVTWHALDPDTGDALQSPLTDIDVDQSYLYTMVLDMSTHIDDFLTGQDQVDFRLSFVAA